MTRRLPPRYAHVELRFEREAARGLRAGARVLDVGSGRAPSLPPRLRPPDCHYVALEVAPELVEGADPAAFDEVVIGDVSRRDSALDGRFDLVLSNHVLEHVQGVEAAMENVRAYLRPGGRFVALLSGTFAAFALANRLLPDRLSRALLRQLFGRERETVFHAYYDRCWYSALERIFAGWSQTTIVPIYHGAEYFNPVPTLRRVYLVYENWIARRDVRNLATHYLITAVR